MVVCALSFSAGRTERRTARRSLSQRRTASAPLISPAALTPGSGFYDVDVDPNNLNILYASVGNPSGAVENGLYKSINALGASPTFNVAGSIGSACFAIIAW